jgi:hypothetical protein
MQLSARLTKLQSYAEQADVSKNGTIATGELAKAPVPKNAKALLASIGQAAGNTAGGRTTDNFNTIARRYVSDFSKLDKDKDGKLSTAERDSASVQTSQAGLAKLQKFLWSNE